MYFYLKSRIMISDSSLRGLNAVALQPVFINGKICEYKTCKCVCIIFYYLFLLHISFLNPCPFLFPSMLGGICLSLLVYISTLLDLTFHVTWQLPSLTQYWEYFAVSILWGLSSHLSQLCVTVMTIL